MVKEVKLLIVGGLIGLLSSVATMFAAYFLESKRMKRHWAREEALRQRVKQPAGWTLADSGDAWPTLIGQKQSENGLLLAEANYESVKPEELANALKDLSGRLAQSAPDESLPETLTGLLKHIEHSFWRQVKDGRSPEQAKREKDARMMALLTALQTIIQHRIEGHWPEYFDWTGQPVFPESLESPRK